jgi:DNA-binding LacI/PurR family transcriptional regulator
MTDVAALAGVSYQTVSRVINGQPGVRPSTLLRVQAAMDELNYHPNAHARSLVSGRSRSIGVISLSSELFGPNSTLHTVDEAVQAAGYATVIASVQRFDRVSVIKASEQLRRLAVDGIVMAGSPHPDAAPVTEALLAQIPLVVIGRAGPGVPTIDTDARAGARKAVRHLLDLGHPTVWHVSGPLDWTSARQRLEGWRAELSAHGLDVPEPLGGGWSASSGHAAGLVLASNPRVSAVFAANDHLALGVMRALRAGGRSVPQDVSVVGFDDVPEAAYFEPPLTTVRQAFSACAKIAVSMLMSEVEGTGMGRLHRQKIPRLVVRDSTAEWARAGSRSQA